MQGLFTSVLLTSVFFAFGVNAQESAPAKPANGSTALVHPVTSVSLSPDGKLLAIAKRTSIVSLWDTASGKLVREIPGYTWFMPLSRFGGNGIRLQRHIDAIAFSREGNFLVTCHGDGVVEFWDTTEWKSVRRFDATGDAHRRGLWDQRPDYGVWSLAISKDAKWLVTGSKSTTQLWDAARKKHVLTANVSAVGGVALSADGNTLVAGAQLWNLAKTKELFQLGVERGLWNDALPFAAKDAPAVVTGSQVNSAMAVSDDGTRLAIYGYRDSGRADDTKKKFLRTMEVASGESMRNFEVDDATSINCLVLTKDNKLLIGGVDKGARLWDAATGRQLAILQGYSGTIQALAVSADSKLLATGSADGTARLWDLATGKELRVFAK